MSSVTYTALRSLMSGVTYGDPATLEFDVTKLDRSTGPVVHSHTSLAGLSESRRDRTDVYFDVTPKAEHEDSTAVEALRQFLDSVDGGEEFTFDPYGTIASPVMPLTVVMDKPGYKESRETVFYLTAGFRVRVVPT